MMSPKLRTVGFAIAYTALLAGCDAAQSLVPEVTGLDENPTPTLSFAIAPVSVEQGNRVAMFVGDSVQLQFPIGAKQERLQSAAMSVIVKIAPYGSFTEVLVPGSAQFDPTRLDPASMTLGTVGGAKVPLSKRQDGSYVKVVTGGRYPSVYFYFWTDYLNPGGAAPSATSLSIEGRHPAVGTVRGTLAGESLPIENEPRAWSSASPEVLSVSPSGVAVARRSGSAAVKYGTSTSPITISIDVSDRPVTPPTTPAPPVTSSGDFVTYANARVEAILGAQLKAGAAANPWSFFDSNALARGLAHGAEFPAVSPTGDTDYYMNLNYYDQGLVQYQNYYRTGDTRFLQNARKLNDSWYGFAQYNDAKGWGTAPRNSSMGGLMLRALDGRPEMWPFITNYVREMFQMWVGARVGYPQPYYGLRDGGYMLTYAAWLAQVHPDATVRAEFREKSLTAAKSYYVRLQHADGGWYWQDEGSETSPGGVWEQPFMVGLLLEGMIEVHQMTGDPAVAQSIIKAVDHLYSRYRTNPVLNSDGTPNSNANTTWRSVGYFNYTNGVVQGETVVDGEVKNASGVVTKPGWDTNTIREGRQRNTLVVHAFGYAYHLTKNAKYRQQGDEIFSATYGKGSGPGADAFYGLADFRAKEYNQAYRSAGRYLAWRAM